MKVLSIVGTRPQLLKSFVLLRRLQKRHDVVFVHTGEQTDERLTSIFFDQLSMPEPDYDFSVGQCADGRQTGRMMTFLEDIIVHEEPDAVVVYGDSNTTLAGALTAAKRSPTVAHVEAGVRCHDHSRPPEINRIQVDHAADLLFAPCERAVEQLRTEGIKDGIYLTGDVTIDAVTGVYSKARECSTALSELDLDPEEYVLSTVHLPRNTENERRLASILRGLSSADRPVVLPAHPETVEQVREYGLRKAIGDDVRVINPVGYLDFVRLLDGAERVATDSGGVQRESLYLDTPCVTFRPETEWIETVRSGWNVLVDADEDRIRRELSSTPQPSERPTPYGRGRASESILEALEETV